MAQRGRQDAGGDAGGGDAAADGAAAACDALDCSCERFCGKIEAAGCAKDPPREDCEAECKTPDSSGCAEEQLAFTRCQAQRPQLAYGCREPFDKWMLDGCEAEADAYGTCVMDAP
jgi:hypothetical protein